jgi:hypothetical protein
MAKKKAAGAGPVVIDQDEQDISTVVEGDQVPIAEEWIPAFLKSEVPFFDAVAAIPDGGWEKTTIYLYRLEPAVANKQGEKKYIGVYGGPINEQSVKDEHGGGKYHAYVKYGVGKMTSTLRNHRFWIDGEPIYKEGQTSRTGPTAGAPVIPGQQDIGSIVRQVIEATGGNTKAADAGIEVMKRAFMDGLDLTKSIATNNAQSATGTTLGDKLLTALLPRLTEPQSNQLPPMVEKFMDAAITIFKSERKEPNPVQPAPLTDQFTLIKDVMGVESLRELFDMTRGGRDQPWWVAVLSNAVEKLPTLLNEFAQMQERAFQRAVIAHQLGAGQPAPPAPILRTETAPIPPGRFPAPPSAAPAVPSNGTMPEQMIAGMVDGICRAYDEGYPGDMAAVHLKLLFPQLVDSLRPLLSDPQQLSNFVRQTPALAERASEEDWAGFQREFLEEVRQVPIQDMPVEANTSRSAADVPSGPAAPAKTPKPAARKTVAAA